MFKKKNSHLSFLSGQKIYLPQSCKISLHSIQNLDLDFWSINNIKILFKTHGRTRNIHKFINIYQQFHGFMV